MNATHPRTPPRKASGHLPTLVAMTVILLPLIATGPAETYAGTILHVDDDAPNDPGPGTPTLSDPQEDGSPAHPYDSIQEAINAATDGDEVIVADGTYTGPGNRDLDFPGKPITVGSENGPESCIIDCEQSGRGFHFHTAEGPDSVIQGLTVTGGLVDTESLGYPGGGGVHCGEFCGPTIQDCSIIKNSAAGCHAHARVGMRHPGSLLRRHSFTHSSSVTGGSSAR